MTIEQIITGALDTASAHLADQHPWAPVGLLVALLLGGLGMTLRGAKWAPGLTALVFAGGGAWGGVALAHAVAVPEWIGGALFGLLGLGAGYGLFRVWQAALLGAVLATAGVSVYFTQTLAPHVDTWVHGAPEHELEIVLPEAGTVVGDQQPGPWAQTQDLWNHLAANVPNFEVSFAGIAGIPLLAGLVFGWLAPRFSRALWGASLGTLLTGVAVTALLDRYWPGALAWLQADPVRGWLIVAVFWVLALAYNLWVMRKKRPDRERAELEENAGASTAKPVQA